MKKPALVNYDTQWTNHDLEPSKSFYFKANTLIKDILPQLEAEINASGFGFKDNYQTEKAYYTFNRLYRNVIPHFKGWQVLYREPNSQKPYHQIDEKIGYKPRTKKRISLQRTVLKRSMRWTHELDLLIKPVVIEGTRNCKNIVKQLNHQITQPCFDQFFHNLRTELHGLFKRYKLFKDPYCLGLVNYENHEGFQTFCNDLHGINKYCEQFSLLMNKDYKVHVSSISDVLHRERAVKTAKGWTVRFLDKIE